MLHIVRLIDYKSILGPYIFEKDRIVYVKNRIFYWMPSGLYFQVKPVYVPVRIVYFHVRTECFTYDPLHVSKLIVIFPSWKWWFQNIIGISKLIGVFKLIFLPRYFFKLIITYFHCFYDLPTPINSLKKPYIASLCYHSWKFWRTVHFK